MGRGVCCSSWHLEDECCCCRGSKEELEELHELDLVLSLRYVKSVRANIRGTEFCVSKNKWFKGVHKFAIDLKKVPKM